VNGRGLYLINLTSPRSWIKQEWYPTAKEKSLLGQNTTFLAIVYMRGTAYIRTFIGLVFLVTLITK